MASSHYGAAKGLVHNEGVRHTHKNSLIHNRTNNNEQEQRSWSTLSLLGV